MGGRSDTVNLRFRNKEILTNLLCSIRKGKKKYKNSALKQNKKQTNEK